MASKGRVSIATVSSRRTSSAPRQSLGMGRKSSISARSDPRNISDKRFVPTSIRTLIEFLTAHNYDHAISPKILTSPSGKDFNNIVQFLFRLIDPNLSCPGKFEDEVIAMFKQLRYPYNISKNGLSAVGSPHSWPQLLACIMWVVELLEYDEAAHGDGAEHDGGLECEPDSTGISEKLFFAYLRNAYVSFLGGDDDTYAALEEEFVGSFEAKNATIVDQTEELDRRNSELEREIQQVEGRRLKLPQLREKKKDYENDLEKFETLIDQLSKYKETAESKKASRQQDLEKTAAAITAVEDDIASLKEAIAKQELSPEDVRRMSEERERLQAALESTSEASSTLQKKVWDAEVALRDKVQALEEAVRLFNSMAEDLDLKAIEDAVEGADSSKIKIDIDIRAKKRSDLMTTDVRRDVIPRLNQFKAAFSEATVGVKGKLILAQDALEEGDLEIVKLQENKLLLESKLRRSEEAYRKEKTTLEAHAATHDKEMDELESKLIELRDLSSVEARAVAASRTMGDLKAQVLAGREVHEKRKAETNKEIMAAVTALADYKELVQRRLGEVKEMTEQRLQKVLQMDERTCSYSAHALRSSRHHLLQIDNEQEKSLLSPLVPRSVGGGIVPPTPPSRARVEDNDDSSLEYGDLEDLRDNKVVSHRGDEAQRSLFGHSPDGSRVSAIGSQCPEDVNDSFTSEKSHHPALDIMYR
eukprot:CAMPEP_0185030192 /NCGR_PEP_ID=MMETSP1103-20130426/16992_1 /TAXON_ID=36769 /ORGANISM="Paraphysomonas bandaiensis, Strain Caron Lab Isolate" /LENGTH=701 /DNA_ID=CAMNT_0027565207 /DNA_START=115 /DNA_END=2223 /DNA_ORIENTATION=-